MSWEAHLLPLVPPFFSKHVITIQHQNNKCHFLGDFQYSPLKRYDSQLSILSYNYHTACCHNPIPSPLSFICALISANQQAFATQGLNRKDYDNCGAVIGIFQSLLDALCDRSITPKLLKILVEKTDKLDKSIEAINYVSSEEKDLAQNPEGQFSKRKREYNEFRRYREQLQHLYLYIEDLNVEGTSKYE